MKQQGHPLPNPLALVVVINLNILIFLNICIMEDAEMVYYYLFRLEESAK